MKATELIEKLEELIREHGDQEVNSLQFAEDDCDEYDTVVEWAPLEEVTIHEAGIPGFFL